MKLARSPWSAEKIGGDAESREKGGELTPARESHLAARPTPRLHGASRNGLANNIWGHKIQLERKRVFIPHFRGHRTRRCTLSSSGCFLNACPLDFGAGEQIYKFVETLCLPARKRIFFVHLSTCAKRSTSSSLTSLLEGFCGRFRVTSQQDLPDAGWNDCPFWQAILDGARPAGMG